LAEPEYTVYVHRRRRRWPYFIGAAACVLAALVAWQVLGVPRVAAVTPGPDAFVNDPHLAVVLDVKGLQKLKDVRVTFDGSDVTAASTRSGNTLTFTTPALADGEYRASFSAASSNLLRRDVRQDWHFTVDTRAPLLKLDGAAGQGRINTSPATFNGSTEPHATVTVTSGAVESSTVAGADGKYTVSAALPDGPSTVSIDSTDRAGNSTADTLEVYVDAVPPTLAVTAIPRKMRRTSLKLSIAASDQLGAPKVRVVLDGEESSAKKRASGMVFKAADLAQGTHTLIVSAGDKGGNVTVSKQSFVVDSTERFGSEAMWPGARGRDVKQLQKVLTNAGAFSGARSNTYDGRTEAAVKKYQEKSGLTVDGKVDGDTLTALGGRIIIDLGDLQLYLYRGDKLYKSYPIAVGQAAYPTPTGSFVVVNMQVDPTWIPPPDAAWAKGAKPIPPGPNNPLGTRWIGTSYPGVGIHGTPDDASIGTYASHGCIRMHIPDVEDLYTRVVIGMPVIIRP
jgi:lipoprotein-anchoring transpeptidase ErfK/SrfK